MDHEAGFIQVKVCCNSLDKNEPCNWKSLDAWKKKPPRRLATYKIRCFIFQCSGIQCASGEEAKTYVSVFDHDVNNNQTIVKEGANPVIREIIDVWASMTNLEGNNAPPILINVWD